MADITAHVRATLTKHYPAHVLGWVRRATWKRDQAVPLSKIDMSRRPGGRDPAKVAGIAQAVKDGKPMPPVVLVDTGEAKLQVADGYHRTLGYAHAGKRAIPALIASGVGRHGPWEKRMHDAKLNLTASHTHALDLAGVCTGPGPCDTKPFGAGDNWVTKVGGLDPYLRAVAHALVRKGLSESEAIQRAWGIIRNWAEGKGNVKAETRAHAVKSVANMERKRAQAHSLTADASSRVDLAFDSNEVRGPDGRWLRIAAAKKRAEADRIAASASTGDRAAGRLSAPGLAQATRHTDSSLRRHVEATAAAQNLEHRANLADARAKESARPRLGHEDIKGAKFVRDRHGWHEVVRVNAKTITVKTPYSWTDSIPHEKIHEVRKMSGTALTAAAAMPVDLAWNEALHPRKGGKFAPKGTPASTGTSGLPANMEANVRDFQKRVGLPVTGVIDQATAAKIRGVAAAKTGRKGRKGAAAKARATQRRALGQQVSRVNSLSSSQRASLRQRMPVPPTGYVWTATNSLRAAPLTRSQQAAPLTGI